MIPQAFDERMRILLGSSAAVDPERFALACQRLDVWQPDWPTRLRPVMERSFGKDWHSAAVRFLDLQECLQDGTLTEFQCSTEDGMVLTPYEVVYAAAVSPVDDRTGQIDRALWFDEIMRRLA